LTDKDALSQMNDIYKNFLVSEGREEDYVAFANNNITSLEDYCYSRFANDADIHDRQVCLLSINKDPGASGCLEVP
jgi:hypothetical protein